MSSKKEPENLERPGSGFSRRGFIRNVGIGGGAIGGGVLTPGLADGAPLPAVQGPGAVDITLYRDDAATALPNPKIGPSKLPSVDGKRVVLVDDVLHTGRTIRAALDAVLDFGRPKIIELAVLVDRGGRELPIQPDYTGMKIEVGATERVELVWKRTGPGPDDEEPWAIRVAKRDRDKETP